MTREEAIKVLEMFLHKQCDLERTKFAYDANTVWKAVKMASEALEKELIWTPCSEGLSNENEWVLVTTGHYQKPMEVMCYQGTRIGKRDVGNGWEEYEYPSWTSGHGDIKSSHPKAWMPLPESYSEVKE